MIAVICRGCQFLYSNFHPVKFIHLTLFIFLLIHSPAFSADQNVTTDSGGSGGGTLWNAINTVGSGDTITFQGPYTITYNSSFPTLGNKSATFVTINPGVMLQSTDSNNTYILSSSGSMNVSGDISFLNNPADDRAAFGFRAYNQLNITSDFTGSASITSTNTQNAGKPSAIAFYSDRGFIEFQGGISGDILVENSASRTSAGIYAQKGITIDNGFAQTASITVNNTAANASNGYAYGIRALNYGITFSSGDFAGSVAVFSERGTAAAIRADDDLIFEGNFSETASVSSKSNSYLAYGLQGDNVRFDGIFAGDVSATGRSSYGLRASHTLNMLNGFTATASITSQASDEGYGILARDIDINNGMSGAVRVSGASTAYGLRAYDDISIDGVFNSNIQVTSESGEAFGIYADNLYGANAGDQLTIAGIVSAQGQTGAAGIYITEDSTNALDLLITGTLSGVCTGTGPGYAILSKANTDDTVVIQTGAIFQGAMDLGGGTDTLTNLGSIRSGNTLGTISVSGNYTQGPTGVLDMGINAQGDTDLLAVGGSATLGGTLRIIPQFGGYTDRSYAVVTSNAKVGAFANAAVYYPDTQNVSFSIEHTPTGLDVISRRVRTFEELVSSGEIELVMARYLDLATGNAEGELNTLMALLDFMPDQGVEPTLGQLLPNTVEAGKQISLKAATLFNRSTRDHMYEARRTIRQSQLSAPSALGGIHTGMNTGDAFLPGLGNGEFNAYARLIHDFGDFSRDNWGNKISYTVNGLDAGMDFLVSDSFFWGVNLGFASSTIKVENTIEDNSSISSYRAGIFASFFDKNWFADAALSYVINDNSWERNISIPGTTVMVPGLFPVAISDMEYKAQADFFSHTIPVHLGTGYDFSWRNFIVTPTASLDYAAFFIPDYDETGANALNLRLETEILQSLQSGLGLRMAYTLKNLTKYGHFTPEIRAEWRHEFLDGMNDITASMEGAPGYSFTVPLPSVDTDFAIFGGGFTAALSQRMEAAAMYQASVSSNSFGHHFNVSLKIRF